MIMILIMPLEARGDFEIIPPGAIVKLFIDVKPPNREYQDPYMPYIHLSRNSDVQYALFELTVMEGEYTGKKLWERMTMEGGKVNEKGESIAVNIAKAKLRAIIESSKGIKPSDDSPQAKMQRAVKDISDFSNLVFGGEIGINEYDGKTKNVLKKIITPDKPQYAELSLPDMSCTTPNNQVRQQTPQGQTQQQTYQQPSNAYQAAHNYQAPLPNQTNSAAEPNNW